MSRPPHYYNEFDTYAAAWLQNLINAGLIPAGVVDTRSIADVQPQDLAGFRQCHFFAGIGGWALAARLAGWPDDRELWTGSAPCQPFSVAGQQRGTDDDRHLWPHLFRLASARRPAVLMGEQVAAAVGKDWLDGIATDLESIGYTCGAAVVPACAVDAPHRRDRLWFVADALHAERWAQPEKGDVEHGQDAGREKTTGRCPMDSAWSGAGWIIGHDGKARRVEPSIRLLAHGASTRRGRLRAYGNAIVPQVAAEVIGAYMDCMPAPPYSSQAAGRDGSA